MNKLLLAAAVSAAAVLQTVPFDTTWTAGSSTAWNTPAQWSGGTAPLPCATITVTAEVIVSDADENIDEIIIGLDGELVIALGAQLTTNLDSTATCCDNLDIGHGLGYALDADNRQCVVNSQYPTAYPTASPTVSPTAYPTAYPTASPTKAPTAACVPGQYGVGGDSCAACPAGKWSSVYNLATCTECLKGTYSEPSEYATAISHNIGNFRGCVVCPSGKYQPDMAKDNCTKCAAGYHGDSSTQGSIEFLDQCTHCDDGQFQHEAGSLECSNCPSGKFSAKNWMGATYVHERCLGCEEFVTCTTGGKCDSTADMVNRTFWTRNEAGWDTCEKKALDCNMPAWQDDYTTCSKTCKNTDDATVGDKTRRISPVYQAWGDSNHVDPTLRPRLCEDTGIVGVDTSQEYIKYDSITYEWEQRTTCNPDWCPIDCIMSTFAPYDTCTKPCGGGTTNRTRSIVRDAQYGGKPCTSSTDQKACNTHICLDAECHKKHLHCNAAAGHVVVTHDRLFSSLTTDYKCAVEGRRRRRPAQPECKCKCAKNPTACFQKNKILTTGALILGNKHTEVLDIEACSNLCAHHPDCESWVFNSKHVCVLNDATAVFADNHDDNITTWAGNKFTSGGCVVQGHYHMCVPGEYRAAVADHGTDESPCKPCPAGRMSHKSNADTCDLVAMPASGGCPVNEFIWWQGGGATGVPLGVNAGGIGANQIYCALCEEGTTSNYLYDHTCHGKYYTGEHTHVHTDVHDLYNSTSGTQHHGGLDSQFPTPHPTMAPTVAPTAPICITECVNTDTNPDHSTLAPCLACKALLSVADFCTQYGIPNGVTGC
jgi:hypothetical protein